MFPHRRLVVLDRHHVIATLGDHFLTEIALAERGIAGMKSLEAIAQFARDHGPARMATAVSLRSSPRSSPRAVTD